MTSQFRGCVQAGKGDASNWLGLFSASYERKLGYRVYPGSLNLALDHDFDWFSAFYIDRHIHFDRKEMGGERDILMVRCVLSNLEDQPAYLWTTTTAARERPDPWVVEIIAEVGLRSRYDLSDGDFVEVLVL